MLTTTRLPLRARARLSLLALLCFWMTLGCDSVTEPDAAATILTADPQASVIPGIDGLEYTVIQASPPEEGERVASAVIGRYGGFLRLADHYLFVPPGALRGKALFTAELAADGHVRFDLHAVETGPSSGTPARFYKPVFLVVSYGEATNLGSPDDLTILYEPEDGGPAEVVKSWVMKGPQRVVGKLEHFSRYCLASN